ncbi:MAG: glycoside hydrolase family 95 protein [Ruminococcaceae bacterium]|nr:glycoside hydrolase family 95 protein [Oscillospiraceae bacterium]
MENKLWYKNEANKFEEALPLGNGAFGAMVYGKTQKEKISLNLDTLWSGKKTDYVSENATEAYKKAQKLTLEGKIKEAEEIMANEFHNMWSAFYLPMAELTIERSQCDKSDYYRELNIEEAITKAKFGNIENEAFISNPDDLMVFNEKAGVKTDYTLTLNSKLKNIIKIIDKKLILNGRCPTEGGSKWQDSSPKMFKYKNDEGVTFTVAIKILTDGEIKSRGTYLTVLGATKLTLLIAAKSSFVSFDKEFDESHQAKCFDILNNAESNGIEKLKENHILDFKGLFNKTKLDLMQEESPLSTHERLKNFSGTDIGLTELLFNYGKYLTISSSRKGTQATNLQGIWNEELFAPWRSNYTVNINTEMNYWPTLSLGLYDCFEPFINLVKKISVTGKAAAKNYYGAEGFCAHHNVDLWGHASPVGGKNNIGSNYYANWCLSSGWMSSQLYWYYEYTLDKEFLKETIYPILKEASKFYLSVLIEDKGEYILCPSSSPENSYINKKGEVCCLNKKVTMSQSIIKELFENTVTAAKELNIDSEFTELLNEKIEKINPYQIGSDGRLLEWDKEYAESDLHHRHVSHVYGIYPGEHITTEKTPDLAEAVKKTLEARGDAGTGWSLGWKINLWAKLKEGDHAYKLICDQLHFVDTAETNYSGSGGTYTNMMDAHPPFQIDGNFGAVSGITQLFIQHECGKIKILPALPSIFKSGEIKGIKTKGNISVSVIWENNKAKKVTFISPIEQTVKTEIDGEVYKLSLKKNKETVLDF